MIAYRLSDNMAKYIELGDRKIIRSGTSLALTVPNSFVQRNGIKKGDSVEVRWDGGTDLLIRAKNGKE
jgi:antitoxin component of MazEF toxin-antitoxin module